jgi:hypothetical protein
MYKDMNSNKYFKTTSFYLAAFLFTKGVELVNIDKISDHKRAQFIFVDSPQRKLWLESFNFGKENAPEVMVDARKFVMAIKMLKDKLYQDRF